MPSDATTNIGIIDRNSEASTNAITLLRFTLNEEPPEQWRASFSGASRLQSGSFNFIHSQPELKGDTITWAVPADEVGTATTYVEQAIAQANQGSHNEAEQARARKDADESGVTDRRAEEARQAELRKQADSAGAAERQSRET